MVEVRLVPRELTDQTVTFFDFEFASETIVSVALFDGANIVASEPKEHCQTCSKL